MRITEAECLAYLNSVEVQPIAPPACTRDRVWNPSNVQPIERIAPLVFNVVQAADQLAALNFEVDPPYPLGVRVLGVRVLCVLMQSDGHNGRIRVCAGGRAPCA
jgi:hypothetical protein